MRRGSTARELREELGIEAQIGQEIERYDFNYVVGQLTRLVFLHVSEFAGEPENLDFTQIAWAQLDQLPEYDFLEGDVAFVRRLAVNSARNRSVPGT